jgi:hypothetical protein
LPIDKDIVLIRLIQWNGLDVIIPMSAAPSVKPGALHTLPNRRVIHRIANFDVLLTVHLSILIVVINQLDAQNFILQ